MRCRWGLLGFAGVVALTGCAMSPGPIHSLNADTIECADAALYDDIAAGILLDNTASSVATVTDVEFATLDGVSIAGLWIAGQDRVGDEYHGYGLVPFPPDSTFTPGWADRVEAIGAEIPAGREMFLVVRLRRELDAAPGVPRIAARPRITYTVDGLSYSSESNAVIGFGVDADCDTSDDE